MQQKNADRQAERHPPTECLVGMYAKSQPKEVPVDLEVLCFSPD